MSDGELNKGDLVFERVAEGLYVMIANRFGRITDFVYDIGEINEYISADFKVEIR